MSVVRNPASWLVLSIAVGAALATLVLAGFPGRTTAGDAAPTGTAARSMSVFRGPQRVSVRFPAVVRGFALTSRPARVSKSLFEGAWRLGAGRLLISGIGPSRARLYAVPTTQGVVCQVILAPPTAAAGGCIADFSSRNPAGLTVFDPDATDAGKPVIIGGVIPDDTKSIHVIVGGRRVRAVVRHNAYLYQLAKSDAYPAAVVAEYTSGTSRTIKIPDPRPAMRACAAGNCPTN
jgi:hypothetical protein